MLQTSDDSIFSGGEARVFIIIIYLFLNIFWDDIQDGPSHKVNIKAHFTKNVTNLLKKYVNS